MEQVFAPDSTSPPTFMLETECSKRFSLLKTFSVQENYTFASRAQRMPNSASVACRKREDNLFH